MWVAGDTLLMLEETIDGTGSLRLTAHALSDGSDLGLPDGLAPLGGANAALRVAVSPDGSLVAVGSADGVLRCFDIGKWEFVWTGEAGMRPAHALAFVSGGDELFVQSDEGARMLLSAADGTVLKVSAGTAMGMDADHYRGIACRPMAYGQALTLIALSEALKQA